MRGGAAAHTRAGARAPAHARLRPAPVLPPLCSSLSLDFICYDQPGFVQSQDAVFEDVTCGYHALLYSRAGCPVQCPVVSAPGAFGAAKVCAGQGLCDYDSDKSAARCFCDNGWGGVDCTTAGGAGVPPVSWPALGGTVVGGIVLGIALLLGGVFARSYMAGGSFFDYLNFFGSGAACACGLGSLPLPWGAKASASAAGDYAPAPSEPSYKAPAPEPPSAFTSSVMHHEAPATGYAPPSGSLNDGPLL